MPCLSLKHVIAVNTREKRARAAYKALKKRQKAAEAMQKQAAKALAKSSTESAAKRVPAVHRKAPRVIYPEYPSKIATYADMINAESRLGSTLFGPIPDGHRREFFHDRKNIWIWHEDWIDDAEKEHKLTIRYEVRPTGVYKKVAAGSYFRLEGAELENFRSAAHAYLNLIKNRLYNNPSLFA